MLPDYVLLPPEVNSARMYAGPRSGSMWAAAAAWDALAVQLSSAASSFGSTVMRLTDGGWQGLGSMSMTLAAAPYVVWLTTASTQAESAASQARLSAAAFEAAFTATVPPVTVAANRAQLAMLIATNILGQNTPAIAMTEALYAEMWAQDATAMTGYDAGTTAAEAHWTAFRKPPPASLAGPSALTSFAQTDPQLLSSMGQSSNLLSTLQTTASRLEMLSTPAEAAMEPMNMLGSQLMSGAQPLLGGAGGAVPAMNAATVSSVGPSVGGSGTAPLSAGVVSAGVGQAGTVGRLSVPAAWANAAPAATPTAPLAAAPTAGVTEVSAKLPALPSLPSMGTPGRAIGAVSPAVDASRAGIAPRPGLG